jgi:sec-independent protein translocase protein TatA
MPFGLQPLHLVVIAVVALIIFGPERLPEIGRGLGRAISEFRRGAQEMTESFSQEVTRPAGPAAAGPELPPKQRRLTPRPVLSVARRTQRTPGSAARVVLSYSLLQMNLDTLPLHKIGSALLPSDSPWHELAQTICAGALAKALRNRSAYTGDEPLFELDLRRPAVLESIKDGLAQGVASALAACDSQVQTVYAYDPSANPDNETGEDRAFDAALHLLVVVTQPSTALQSFISALDRALIKNLNDLPFLNFQLHESILDIILLTPKDIEHRTGYAGLVSSIFAPALEIWRR